MKFQLSTSVVRILLAAICLLVFLPKRGDSLPSRLWPYKALVSESDLVIIGMVRSTTLRENKEFSPEFLDELESEISVRAVLKGEVPRDKVRFVHYRYKKGAFRLGNGPSFPAMKYHLNDKPASKAENAPETDNGRNKGPFYLYFLKRRSDGRFEPVSGNDFAALSVARIEGYADEE